MKTAKELYYENRHLHRKYDGRREDNGLPHHPDFSGWAACHACGGTGIYYNQFDRSGQSDVPCDDCGGDGVVLDGYRDPLVRMSEARRFQYITRYKVQYDCARGQFKRPNSGMARLRMCELAIGCEIIVENIVASMREEA